MNQKRYFLGADVGSSKTHVLIADESGQAFGFGESGSGNHEGVGYDGLAKALRVAFEAAMRLTGLSKNQIAGAGFGVAGFDWPSEKADTLHAIHKLGLQAPVEAVNDATLGILAGSEEGWGVAIVSGTGCNCRGWDKSRQHEGMVTGAGLYMGEGSGSSELVYMAIRAISKEWSRRGPATALTPALVKHAGARDLADLLEGLVNQRYGLSADAAPVIFEVATTGDQVARDLIRWAGCELGELAKGVIRQLEFENLEFDVVMIGSMFNGGPLLIEPMKETILALAPKVSFIRLEAPPVIGGVLLGMELVGARTEAARQRLISSFDEKRYSR
jgi:N-acetylglucosamine kinase-like BadF-type ATPase